MARDAQGGRAASHPRRIRRQSKIHRLRLLLAIAQAAAPALAIELIPSQISNDTADVERAIESFARVPEGALLVVPDATIIAHHDLFISLAARYRLPAVYPWRYFVTAGALMSYGIDNIDVLQKAAAYVDRILRGAKPVDLPVQAPTKYETGWSVVQVFEDAGISEAKGRKDRPALDALLKSVARREVDMVAAWSVDRLGRSLTDLLDFLRELHAKGVDLFLHQQGLDTSTPAGRAMFQMMGVFAEFERAMIRERVLAGLARAKEQGINLGRRRLEDCDAAKVAAIKRALAAKRGVRWIARDLKTGIGTPFCVSRMNWQRESGPCNSAFAQVETSDGPIYELTVREP